MLRKSHLGEMPKRKINENAAKAIGSGVILPKALPLSRHCLSRQCLQPCAGLGLFEALPREGLPKALPSGRALQPFAGPGLLEALSREGLPKTLPRGSALQPWAGPGLLEALPRESLPKALPRGSALQPWAGPGHCLEAPPPRERLPEALPRGTASGAPSRGTASRHCLGSAFTRH